MRLIKFYGHWINPLAIESISPLDSKVSVVRFNSGAEISVPDETSEVIKTLAEKSSKGLATGLWN